VSDSFDIVTVFGGDGTTMQAAAALVGTGVGLGVIPGGTGNLLAGNLRIPPSPARAARSLLTARPLALDLGRIDRADGPHFFAVACGAGYDARVMAETTSKHKRRWGMGAYVATTFRLLHQLRNAQHRITVDGSTYEVSAALVLVANCAEVIPPFLRLRRGISPTDGILDVLTLRAGGFLEGVLAVWDLLRERDVFDGQPGRVGYTRGREIHVESDPPEPVEMDGETHGLTPFTTTVVPGAIRVMAPFAP
jgi:diacylglycerol kinase family enzyme